jgi:hypothetical protein
MADWNALHPEWAYREPSNFAHDCLQARRRLLGADDSKPQVGGGEGQHAEERQP